MWLTAVVFAATAAASPAAEPAPAHPASIKIGLQSVIAPFVLSDHASGLFADVLRAAFASQQVNVEFLYLPNVRFDEQFRQGLFDVTTASAPGQSPDGYLSRWPVTYFHNMAITLRSRIPTLSSMDELKKYRVTAFRNAQKALGPAYAAATANHPQYREATTMPSGTLFLDRTDVIISQPDVFRYYLKQQLPQKRHAEPELAYHDVLGPGKFYWMRFRTEAQRDMFERGITQLYASGEIDRILARYQSDYGVTRDFFIALDCQFRPELAPQKCKNLSEMLH
ncbi:transporter substrate-binding domain-containing protein [Duganella violaceipulchra]|uniref:ABC-type amino acid transport substrate-binding protein n=1 Tax=Duganella violaceipulchra TaxID=2849652 RepID=A0AA41HBS8_9BURK|nr:transporter substrate-binding domain-containing protein [Duganella violaceicalia]MBV6324495.1 transporter substrate-binding domain-containing protein [Duganella violaceicalia]MCP2012100.1 ABC-type amino acid transport substrate-binding protein [Duganella violaceicalia]